MNVGHRIPVRDCGFVQGTVVTTRTPVTRGFLRYHVERRRPGTGGGLNDAQLEHMLKLLFSCLEAIGCTTSGACRDRGSNSLDVMCDVVFGRGVWGRYLGKGRELRQEVEVGVGVVFRIKRVCGEILVERMPCTCRCVQVSISLHCFTSTMSP